MKKPHFPHLFWLTLLLCLLGLACSKKADSALSTQVQPPPMNVCYQQSARDVLACCSDRLVRDSCAYDWLHQWTRYYQGAQGFGHTYDSAGIVIPNLPIQELLGLCPACTGVRVYFGFEFKDGDSLLSVMLVNLDSNCNDVYVHIGSALDGGILYQSSQETEPRLISRDSAALHAKAWDNLFLSSIQHLRSKILQRSGPITINGICLMTWSPQGKKRHPFNSLCMKSARTILIIRSKTSSPLRGCMTSCCNNMI